MDNIFKRVYNSSAVGQDVLSFLDASVREERDSLMNFKIVKKALSEGFASTYLIKII